MTAFDQLRATLRPARRVTFRMWDSPAAPVLAGTVAAVRSLSEVAITPDVPVSSRAEVGVHPVLIEGCPL